jgi:protein disulfide-isomerase A4
MTHHLGPRENKGIVEHMKQLAKPPSRTVESVAELKNGMSRNETTIVGFFSSKTDLYEEYMLVAHELRSNFSFFKNQI